MPESALTHVLTPFLGGIGATGDWVTALILVVLAGSSIFSWTLILAERLQRRRLDRLNRYSEYALSQLAQRGNIQAGGDDALGDGMQWPPADKTIDPSDTAAGEGPHAALWTAAQALLTMQPPPAPEHTERVFRQQIDRATLQLDERLGRLASIAAAAPLLGLLGTVWALHQILTDLSAQAGLVLAQLAGPIGEAMAMTALGIAVALPALLAHHSIQRFNQRQLMFFHHLAEALMEQIPSAPAPSRDAGHRDRAAG